MGSRKNLENHLAKVAFLFPGQGAQHVGMGKSIAMRFPAAKSLYDQAREILGFDLAAVCFDGPAERLNSTVVSQPALFVTSLAALELLRADHPGVIESCSMAAGLSLGEYTALVFAGVMSFEDGLRVVQRRGEAMQKAADAHPSGMVSALLLEKPQVASICDEAAAAGKIWIANYLCPGNIVLSGEKAACLRAGELIEQGGGSARTLAVAGAFHTPLMESACGELGEILNRVQFDLGRIPVVSNVDAKTHQSPEEIRQILIRQVTQPVLWEDCIRELLAQGCDQFYEIGPGKVLKSLMKRIDRKVDCQTINDSGI